MRKHLFTITILFILYILMIWLKNIPQDTEKYIETSIMQAETKMQKKYKELEDTQEKIKKDINQQITTCWEQVSKILDSTEWVWLRMEMDNNDKEKIKKYYLKNFITLITLINRLEELQQKVPGTIKCEAPTPEGKIDLVKHWKKLNEIIFDPEDTEKKRKIFEPTDLVFEYSSQESQIIRKKLLISMVNFTYQNCVISNIIDYEKQEIWRKFLSKIRGFWTKKNSSPEEAEKIYKEIIQLIQNSF